MPFLQRKIAGLLLLLFLAATLHAQVQLKVLVFNVQHGYGTDNVHSTTRQVQYLIAQKPDVVVMNEVSKGDISGYLQQLKVQSGVVWNSVYFDDMPGKNEGNLIVTRLPITSSATHQYPTTYVAGINMTMSAVEATIAGYCVFGTHLAWKGTVGAQARATQVNDLLLWLSTFSCNKVVMGDFNAGDLDPELQPLYQQYSEVWSQAVRTGVATSYSDNPPIIEARTRDTRHIDLIFTTPGISVVAGNMPDQRVLTKLPVQLVGTTDDLGVRPGDHNFLTAQLQTTAVGTASNLALSTDTVTFPLLGLGSTSNPLPVILSNPGSTAVSINAFASSADFAQTNDCGASLAPGGSCTINVTFTPRASGFRGGMLAVLDDAINSPQIVNLAGSGSLVGLTSISVIPSSAAVPLGITKQFIALGGFSNGTTQEVTRSVTWTSSSTSVAKFNSSIGLATPFLQGTTTVTAKSGVFSGTAILTVTPPILRSITISPSGSSIAKGLTQQFAATGVYSDNSKRNITSLVGWNSSKPLIAPVDSTGLATGLAIGSTSVTVVSGPVTVSTTLSVKAAALVALNITPMNSATALGTKQQFKATGTYTDGSTLDLTKTVTWNVTNVAVATVNNQGLATSVAVGTTSVTATSGTVTGSTTLSITPAVLVSLAITPAISSIPLGMTLQFTATGTFTDGSTQDLTKTVQWSSNASTVATISNVSNTAGLALSVGTGSAQIMATSGTISGSTTINVTAAVLQSIAVTPANPFIALGTTQQFIATGTFSDGSTQDLSSTATWASDTVSTASINKAGLATSIGTGSATISATSALVTGSTVLTVAAATLTSIIINPPNATTPLGTTQQFNATGTYTDGTTQDLTTLGHWSSTAANVATISNSPGTAGVATALSQGITTIGVDMGSISASTTLTVSSTALVSITVNPPSATIALGTKQQFTATGTYADGSTQDVTPVVTWSSSSAQVAIVSNTVGMSGLATSAGVGTASITATLVQVFASANLTVQ